MPENLDMVDTNGWKEYQKMVLHEIERNAEEIEKVSRQLAGIREKDIPGLRQEIALLKQHNAMRSGTIGFFAGLVPAVLGILYQVFNR